MGWSKNAQVEALLRECGLEFIYQTTIPISRIDFAASKLNNPRFNEALDPAIVEQYRTKLASGADFPATVLLKPDRTGPANQPLLILAGNHRLAGAVRNGDTTADAYLVTKWTQRGIDLFVRTDNLVHGKGYTEEQKIEHVVFLHFKYGKGTDAEAKFSVETLVREFAGEQNTDFYKKVNTAIKAKEVSQVLNDKGFDASKVSTIAGGKEKLALIHEYRRHPFVLRDIATYIQRFNPDKKEIEDILEKLDGITGDDERRTLLNRLTEEKNQLVLQTPTNRRTKEKRRQITTTYKAMVSQLLNFFQQDEAVEIKSYSDIGFTDPKEIAELKEKARQLINIIKGLK